MALNNVIAARDQLENSQGQPLAGALIYLYEPGTTTFIQAFKDAALTLPHTAPIKASGSGRANIWINRDADLRIEDRNGNLILTEDGVNPDALGGGDVGGLLQNGGFEDDTNSDGTPDFWVLLNDAGSTNARDTSESTEGAASFRFTSAGTGGGSLTTENFFPVNEVDDLRVTFDLRSTVAAVRNIVRIEWFDVSQISISDTDVYDSTANPLTYTSFTLDGTPPVGARFAKIRLIGIDPSVALAGSTYFDNVAAFYPAVVAGVFDNIEIRNNEIISTNTNGEIDIKPDGTGPVNVISSNAVDLVDVNNPLNIAQVVPAATNPHIAIDSANIQAKADATTLAALNLQPLGGQVNILSGATVGSGASLSSTLTINTSAGTDTILQMQQNGVNSANLTYFGGTSVTRLTGDGNVEIFADSILAMTFDAGASSVSTPAGIVFNVEDGLNINAGSLYLAEVSAGADFANFGQIYVNSSNEPIFRDEGGTETNLLTSGGTVGIDGTPVDNQIAVWTGATNIEGTVGLVYNNTMGNPALGGQLQLTGTNGALSIPASLAVLQTMFVANDRTNASAAVFSKNVANTTDHVVGILLQNGTGSDRDAIGLFIDNNQGEAMEVAQGGVIFNESTPNHTHAILQNFGTMYCRAPLNFGGNDGFNQPVWKDGNNNEIAMLGIKEDISQATTSGADRTFTNRHDRPKKATILLDGCSVSSLGNIRIRVGDAVGGTDTVGYVGRAWATSTAGAVTTATFTDGWNIQLQSASSTLTGHITIAKRDRTSNVWICQGSVIEENAGSSFKHDVYGERTLTDDLDRIVLNASAGTWDAGDATILWET